MEEIKKCIVCGANNFIHDFQCKDYLLTQEVFSVEHCKSCGFKFTSPRPDITVLKKYYNSGNYISHSDKPANLLEKIYYIARQYSLNKKYKLIKSLLPTTNDQLPTTLDIGCGTGEFIKLLKFKNWNVKGIEPNKSARDIAVNKNGLDVIDETQYEKLNDKQFDIITMWHVLEHVYDLDLQINQITRILKDDGILVIAVPNSESFDAQIYRQYWAAYDVPRHLYHFTRKSIKELFNKYDYELINIIPLKLDAYYISILSEKYKTGKNSYINAFINGLKSNLNAKAKESNYSSLTFIFKKKLFD